MLIVLLEDGSVLFREVCIDYVYFFSVLFEKILGIQFMNEVNEDDGNEFIQYQLGIVYIRSCGDVVWVCKLYVLNLS